MNVAVFDLFRRGLPAVMDQPRSAAAIQNTSPSESSVSSQSSGSSGKASSTQFAAPADLADQPTIRRQMVGRVAQDPAHHVETVGAAVEGELRLGPALRRQRRHAFSVDIRRVGDDQVVFGVTERGEQVAAMQADPVIEPVFADIRVGDVDRTLGDIDGIDRGVRKMLRGEDREASRSRAEIEHPLDRAGIVDQRPASPSPPKCDSRSSPMKERGTMTRSST